MNDRALLTVSLSRVFRVSETLDYQRRTGLRLVHSIWTELNSGSRTPLWTAHPTMVGNLCTVKRTLAIVRLSRSEKKFFTVSSVNRQNRVAPPRSVSASYTCLIVVVMFSCRYSVSQRECFVISSARNVSLSYSGRLFLPASWQEWCAVWNYRHSEYRGIDRGFLNALS